jgi:hypothetical protein
MPLWIMPGWVSRTGLSGTSSMTRCPSSQAAAALAAVLIEVADELDRWVASDGK